MAQRTWTLKYKGGLNMTILKREQLFGTNIRLTLEDWDDQLIIAIYPKVQKEVKELPFYRKGSEIRVVLDKFKDKTEAEKIYWDLRSGRSIREFIPYFRSNLDIQLLGLG